MTDRKKLPIGIDIFEKLDRSEFYYIDKTGMIEELLQNRSEVNLFTRPRRFGKSLNMSMLKTFFEIGSNPALFDGLKISENKEICTKIPGARDEQRREIITKLSERGVNTNVHYKPLPMMTAYKNMGWDIKNFPNAYAYYENLITLPLHTKLSDEDVEYVTENFKAVVSAYTSK